MGLLRNVLLMGAAGVWLGACTQGGLEPVVEVPAEAALAAAPEPEFAQPVAEPPKPPVDPALVQSAHRLAAETAPAW